MTDEEILEIGVQSGMNPAIMLLDGNFKLLKKFAKLLAEKTYEKGFFAGFEASGEGFNGEYPYLDNGIDIKTDEYILHALKEAKEKND